MKEVRTKIGQLLRGERERLGKSLAEISNELKISESNLEHVESGNAADLPGELYFNLFARSYAQLLGIDFDATMDAIMEEAGVKKPAPVSPPATKGQGKAKLEPLSESEPDDFPTSSGPARPTVTTSSGSNWIVIVAVLLIGALLAWYFLWYKAQPSDTSPESEQKGAVQESSEIAMPNRQAVLNLVLTARDRTWAAVLADGDTVLATTLKPWREYTAAANERLLVTIASPLEVDVRVNNLPVDLRDPKDSTVAGVEITLATLPNFIKPPEAEKDSLRPDSLEGSELPGDTAVPAGSADRVVSSPPDTARKPEVRVIDRRRDTTGAEGRP